MWKAVGRKQSRGWTESNRMIPTRNTVILLALLLVNTLAEEEPEPIFKVVGEQLDMGFCFGVDIALYRQTAGGRVLLGQYSSPSVSPPDAFKGRINITSDNESLLGLKIKNLQFSDTGIYIQECWSDKTMENYRKHYLYVCNKELSSQDISLTPITGADLVCNTGPRKHTTVRWYRELHNVSLFMDTTISLEPLQAELKSHIQVNDKGSSLHVSDEFIQDRPHFFCLVMEGEQCRSFQTVRLPEDPKIKNIYHSVGENTVLQCSVDHLRQSHWKTPFGQVNSSTPVHFHGMNEDQIFVPTSINPEDYSLVIRSINLEHSGSYKCFSTFLVEEYVLNVCPLLESSDVSFFPGQKKVVLQCDFMSLPALSGKIEYANVVWYRKTGEDDTQILDSGDPSLPIPEDLKGRVEFSQINSSLILKDPKEEDSGTYWCVVLLEKDDDYESMENIHEGEYEDSQPNDDSDDEDEEEEEEERLPFLMEEDYMDMCLFRHVTNLKFKPVRRLPPTIQPEPEPKPETNMTIYAVCIGVGVALLLALIAIVVVLKIRAKKRSASTQGRGVELSEEEGRALKTAKT